MSFGWRDGKNNLIARLKTIYKEIGKQIKHTHANEMFGEATERNVFALADGMIYLNLVGICPDNLLWQMCVSIDSNQGC